MCSESGQVLLQNVQLLAGYQQPEATPGFLRFLEFCSQKSHKLAKHTSYSMQQKIDSATGPASEL